MGKPLLNTSSDSNVQWERTLTMTEPEESALVTMARFFIDNGWIDDETQDAFDTLIEKICEPAPWDYALMTQDGMKHRKDVMPRPWDKSNFTEYYDLTRESLQTQTIRYNNTINETPKHGSSSTRQLLRRP